MILTALADLARHEGLVSSPDYEIKTVHYLISIAGDGQFLGMAALGEQAGRRITGIKQAVPRPLPGTRRTSVSDPYFLVDNASFVLGVNAPADFEKRRAENKLFDPDELRQRQVAFRDLIASASTATGDLALVAVNRFLSAVIEGKTAVTPPPELASNHLIAFRYQPDGDGAVHARAQVLSYWSQRRGSSGAAAGDDASFQCLVTGMECVPADKHPLVKKVPGGNPSGAALVSVNQEAFESYGLADAQNAPISHAAADAYTEALKRLLDDSYPDPQSGAPMPRRNVNLSDDTVVVFWSKGDPNAVDLFADSVGLGEPAAVESLFRATWKGRPVDLHDPAAFYALTITGNRGRATIRGWQEERLGDVLRRVRQYFEDIEIVGRDRERPRPLLRLVASLGVQNKLENAPSELAADLFAAVLGDRPFPYELLAAAIRRTRVEKDNRFQRFEEWQRFGLIRGYLVRARRAGSLPPTFPEVKPMVDEDCRTPAYRLGRLFAVLERVQQDAISPNATIRDRYYGAASATPVVVFPQLLRKLPHHLKNSSRPVFYERLVQEIVDPLPAVAFPATLSLEHQGLFALGYYHESRALFDKAKNTERNSRYFPDTQEG